MLLRCLECFASTAYSCFSKAALTAMAVIKVLVSISIIVIVAVKLEDVRFELQIPGSLTDLTTAAGLANLTANLIAGTTPPAPLPPPPPRTPSNTTSSPSSSSAAGDVDLNTMAGPLHVNASCLLQKRGLNGQFPYNRSMCSYVYTVCGISLMATFAMACLLWCTCHCCGWGPMLELAFALLGTAWWLAAVLVLQENTTVAMNAQPVAWQIMLGNTGGSSQPPPVDPAAALLPPPPPSPPRAPVGRDAASQLAALLQEYTPKSLRQWRQALVGLAWGMMGMFAACAVLLLVEACGCMLDCCSCVCRCCCPDRPESRWRANLRKRKRMGGGEEYLEMRGGMAPSTPSISSGGGGSSSGGGAPAIMVVARSDDGSLATSPSDSRRGGWWSR
ncbi:hypothetical protein PLESTF_001029500 [Pleodorina starrii]|nr:hypothetical protein PLESTF_001029500 [Pleodorina starrii]